MTDRPRSLLLSLCLAALLALLGTACGGDDDDVSSGDENANEQAAEDAISDQLGGECGFLGNFASGLEDQLDFSDALTQGGEIDFGDLFGPLAEEVGEVADAAPDEIRDAFQTVADGFGDVAGEFEGVVVDLSDPTNIDPSVMERLSELETVFEDPEFEAASDEIETWINDNCEVDA